MEGSEIDDGWMDDPAKNESRYSRIMETSLCPVWSLFREAFKEDPKMLLPRMLLASFMTLRRIPRCLLMPRGRHRDRYIFETIRSWAERVRELATIQLEIRGRERIDPDRTYLFVANHTSPMDIPVIYASLPMEAGFVANFLFEHLPVFSYWMKQSGTVFVKQGDGESELIAFRNMVKRLKGGRSLVLFPEGHIYQGQGLGEFKRGGIQAAIFAGVPIIPLCIYGTQNIIRAGSLHAEPGQRVTVEFGLPIETKGLSRAKRKSSVLEVYGLLSSMKARRAADPAAALT